MIIAGYLEFLLEITPNDIEKYLIFQYGVSGYSDAILCKLDRTFLDKHDLLSYR
jgi:hypothetical protein